MATMDHNNLLQRLLRKHRAHRLANLDRDVPFSWTRCLVSIFSYCLLLSDVFRSGLATKEIKLTNIDNDRYLFFGPYGYSVAHVTLNETSAATQDVWAYKYDTTSIAIRAYAEYFQLPAWPPHLLYRAPPPDSKRRIDHPTIFRMLDALVETMAARPRTKLVPTTLTLRTRSSWFDRIHDYVLPQFFVQQMTRTNQALYYSDELLESPGFKFCAQNPHRPFACFDFWTNFARHCVNANPLCNEVDHVWNHIMTRRQILQLKYTQSHLDLLIVEGQTDPSTAAISFQGRKFSDIVVITRARTCSTSEPGKSSSSTNCSTIVIDDFRYESAALSTTVTSFYFIVASLRFVGQTYMWMRLVVLFLGCFYARSAEPQYNDATLATRFMAALRTMFLVPNQVVIYGSIFPISCYVVAHIIDSATVYELVSQSFATSLGVFKLNLREFLLVSAVSMRSVWVLSITLHAILILRTRQNWSPSGGILSIPEFSVTFVSCLTVMAQFRALCFRDTRLEFIATAVPSARVAMIRATASDNTRNVWGMLLLGNTLDIQALIGSAMAMGLLAITLLGVLQILKKMHVLERTKFSFTHTTKVSYAAGTLWPVNCLVVSWSNDSDGTWGDTGPTATTLHKISTKTESAFWTKKMCSLPSSPVRILPLPQILHSSNASTPRGRVARRDAISTLEKRSRENESLVYLMNMALMTDPIVFFQLRVSGRASIGVYESPSSSRLMLLPQAIANSPHDIPIAWSKYELLLEVRSSELPWQDLLHCG